MREHYLAPTPEQRLAVREGSDRVKAAAILLGAELWWLPPPRRHHDLIGEIAATKHRHAICGDSQGFITEGGVFLSRSAALRLVRKTGQLLREPRGRVLTSEDLW